MQPDAAHPSLQGIALATGLEPSHIQFVLGEFRDLFSAAFDARDLDLLRKLHQQLFVFGQPSAAIRAELRRGARRRVWAITSGKGGVGKTTITVNFAVALAQRGLRVLLFDADFGMANAHVFAGVNPQGTLLDVIEGRAALAQIVTAGPAGVQMICGASGVARLADLSPATREALARETLRVSAEFDLLLLDTGAGVAAATLQFLGLAEEMIVVATPNLAATLDAYGVIKAAREARVQANVQVLINEAEDEAAAGTVFGRIKGCAERFLGFAPQLLGWLPADAAFEHANRQRRPLLLAEPEHPASHRLRELASRLAEPAAAARQAAPDAVAAA